MTSSSQNEQNERAPDKVRIFTIAGQIAVLRVVMRDFYDDEQSFEEWVKDIASYLEPLGEEGYLICVALINMLEAAEDIRVDFMVHQINKTVGSATGGTKLILKDDESIEGLIGLLDPLAKFDIGRAEAESDDETVEEGME